MRLKGRNTSPTLVFGLFLLTAKFLVILTEALKSIFDTIRRRIQSKWRTFNEQAAAERHHSSSKKNFYTLACCHLWDSWKTDMKQKTRIFIVKVKFTITALIHCVKPLHLPTSATDASFKMICNGASVKNLLLRLTASLLCCLHSSQIQNSKIMQINVQRQRWLLRIIPRGNAFTLTQTCGVKLGLLTIFKRECTLAGDPDVF